MALIKRLRDSGATQTRSGAPPLADRASFDRREARFGDALRAPRCGLVDNIADASPEDGEPTTWHALCTEYSMSQ